MAGLNNGSVKIRDLNPHTFNGDSEFEEFFGIAYNSVKIECLDDKITFGYEQEDFIKRQLINNNCVGYDSIINMFAIINSYGYTNYWLPKEATFLYPNGRGTYTRKLSYTPNKSGAFLIRGLPANLTLAQLIKRSTDKIEIGEVTIKQNLQAVRTPFIGVVRDDDLRLSLEQAIQKRQRGDPVIIASKEIGEALKGVFTNVPFIAPEVDELNDRERDRLLNRLGTMTANINKRERVQATEVNATVGQCEDYLYILIDNVNRQLKTFDLPFKMSPNNSLEELYYQPADSTAGANNETEQEHQEI